MKSLTLILVLCACHAPPQQSFDHGSEPLIVEPAAKTGIAIQLAVDTVALAGAGVVYLEAGEYDVGNITWASNVTMQCEPDAVLRFREAPWGWMIDARNTTNVQFHGCDFWLDVCTPGYLRFCNAFGAPTNYLTTLNLRGATGVVVNGNTFRMTEPTPLDTQHAVLANGVSDMYLVNNRVHYMQFKAGGTQSGASLSQDIRISDNDFFDPYNFAVSLVAQTDNDGFDSVEISDNHVHGLPSAGAIHIGSDGEQVPLGQLTNVRVTGNVIEGEWGEHADFGLSIQTALDTAFLTVARNHVLNTGATVAPGFGILIKGPQGRVAHRMNVSDNLVGGGFNLQGIGVSVGGTSWVINGNVVDGARGMRFGSADPVDDLILSSNIIKSSGHALEFAGVDYSGVLVSDNLLETDGAFRSALFMNAINSFDALITDNILSATGGTLYGGSTYGSCQGNSPTDC